MNLLQIPVSRLCKRGVVQVAAANIRFLTDVRYTGALRIISGGSYFCIRDVADKYIALGRGGQPTFFKSSFLDTRLPSTPPLPPLLPFSQARTATTRCGRQWCIPPHLKCTFCTEQLHWNCQVGIATGVANGALLHPLNAIKYR